MSLFPRDYTVSPSPRSTINGFPSPIASSPAMSSIASPSMHAYPQAFTSPSFNRDPRPEDERAMASYERRESPGYIPRKDSVAMRRGSSPGFGGPSSPTGGSFMRRGSPLGPSAGKFIPTAVTSRRSSSVDHAARRGSRSGNSSPNFEVTLSCDGDYDEPKGTGFGGPSSQPTHGRKEAPAQLSTSWRTEKWSSSNGLSTSPVSPFTIVPSLAYGAPQPQSPGSPLKVSMIAESFAEMKRSDGKPGAPAAKWGFTFSLPSMPQLDSYHLNLPSIATFTDMSGIALQSLASPFSTPKATDPDLATFASNARRSSSWDYTTYEACMAGAESHEKLGKLAMRDGSRDAAHEFRRANEIYGSAMGFNMDDSEALIRRSRIVLALAAHFESPQDAVAMLRDSASDLSQAIRARALQETVDAFALQAETSTLLCKILLTTTAALTAAGDPATWCGEVGQVARSAVSLWEDAACLFIGRIDEHTGSKQRQAAIQAADALMRLADAALLAARLSPQIDHMASYHDVVEVALDQASAMVMLAKPSPCASGLANPFLTHVHLLSCKNRMARIQHSFALGLAFNEEDVRAIIVDVETLADRETRRAKSMRGSKAAGASASAFKAAKQLGDTKLAYANLLRHAWRNRKSNGGKHIRSASNGSNHGAHLVKRLSKPRFSTYEPIYSPDLALRSRTPSLDSSMGSQTDDLSTNGSASGFSMSLSEHDAVEVARPSIPSMFDIDRAFPQPPTAPEARLHKHKSWMPDADVAVGRIARMDSIALPRPIATNVLWERKSSVIAFDVGAGFDVPFTTDLVDSAWELLDEAMKHYKVGLTLLAASNMSHGEMIVQKAEVLLAISEASLFQAMLSLRSLLAKERRSPSITTAEVYATWAARELGWASVIEGSSSFQIPADSADQSWQAAELGKVAVMTVLRVMWHRENENLELLSAMRPQLEVSAEMLAAMNRLRTRVTDKHGRKDDVVKRFRSRTQMAEMSFGSKEKGFWENFLGLDPKEVVAAAPAA